MRYRFGAWLLVLTLAGGAFAEQVDPGDTSDQAPKYAAFRSALEEAIAHRDAAFFRERSAGAKVRLDGATTLDARFALDDPDDPFWSIASKMVSLGGHWKDKTNSVVYPYVVARFPQGLDPYFNAVVIGRDVNLRDTIAADSKVLGTVSYDIVRLLDSAGGEWRKVQTPAGLIGYINAEYLYRPTDYRMNVKNIKGRWMITSFARA